MRPNRVKRRRGHNQQGLAYKIPGMVPSGPLRSLAIASPVKTDLAEWWTGQRVLMIHAGGDSRQLRSSALLDVFQHRFPEHLIEPGLIATALSAKPCHNIGIQPDGELLLYRAVEGIADCVFPK